MDEDEDVLEDEVPQFGMEIEDDVKLNAEGITKRQPGALYALCVLTGISLLNYIDRYVPSGTKVLYQLTSPIFGYLSDRGGDRRILIGVGIIIWSLATASAFFTVDFWTFLISRTMVGIGEAAFVTVAPSLLSDFFPPHLRNRALTVLYAAIPVGAALGFTLGGVFGELFGWRIAFLLVGLPGVLLAAFTLRIREPGRGVYESIESKDTVDWIRALRTLFTNPLFVCANVGSILMTFATGGIADWLPTYLTNVLHVPVDRAGSIVGLVTVLGGIGGTLFGGFLADVAKDRIRQPYLFVSSITMAISAVLATLMLFLRNVAAVSILVGICQIFIWCSSGPINAIIANSVTANVRSRAFSVNVLLIHLLGDSISPLLIGAISDVTGSLPTALSLVPVAMALSAIVWGVGWRFLDDSRLQYSKLEQQELTNVNSSFDLASLMEDPEDD